MMQGMMTYHQFLMKSARSTSDCVSAGSGFPEPANISANVGTTNWMRPQQRSSAIDMMTVGYVIALFTLRLRRDEFCRMSARRFMIVANCPDCSPATVMLTNMSSKIFGNFARPFDSGSPPSIVRRSVFSTFLNSGFSACSSSVCMTVRMDMPAPFIEAICFVNGTRSFCKIRFMPLIFSAMTGYRLG